MKKDRKNGVKIKYGVLGGLVFRSLISRSLAPPLFALALSLCLMSPEQALAQCEPPGDTGAALTMLVEEDVSNLDLFIIQEESFMYNIMQTAFANLGKSYLAFGKNIETALTDWAAEWDPALRSLTAELHAGQVDQTYRVGFLVDGQVMTEEESRKENLIVEAQKRYTPSELACDIDSTGPGLERAYLISRALNRGLALDDAPRHENATGTISATGKGGEVNSTWTQYVANFCDNTMGDQGCAAPGTLAGQHRDLGALLWGHLQTIDPANPNTILLMQAALRYIVDPLAPDAIAPSQVASADGHSQILERHAELAFTNTIYNTLGAMLSERIGGSNVNVQLMRSGDGTQQNLGAGIPQADASTNASYREIQEAMTRDRFNNPDYLVRLVSDPTQVTREQTTLNALRLQTLNDIYRRSEELLFMESSEYSRDLNRQIPRVMTGKMSTH